MKMLREGVVIAGVGIMMLAAGACGGDDGQDAVIHAEPIVNSHDESPNTLSPAVGTLVNGSGGGTVTVEATGTAEDATIRATMPDGRTVEVSKMRDCDAAVTTSFPLDEDRRVNGSAVAIMHGSHPEAHFVDAEGNQRGGETFAVTDTPIGAVTIVYLPAAQMPANGVAAAWDESNAKPCPPRGA